MRRRHTALPRVAPALLAALCLAACGPAAALGFQPVAGGTLALQPLPIDLPAGTLSPLQPQGHVLLRQAGAVPTYFVAAGLGVPRLKIADQPGAAAWQVTPDATACARLVPVPLATVKAAGIEPVPANRPLPLACAAGFTDQCSSTDGALRIQTTFAGTHQAKRVGGGFFGGERPVETRFYTGTRTLAITHVASGRQLQLQETLEDTPAFSAPQTAIRFLPELQRVLLLGATYQRGVPQAGCVALPAP